LTCAISAANVNDGEALKALVRGIPAMLGIACIPICYKHLAKHADGF